MQTSRIVYTRIYAVYNPTNPTYAEHLTTGREGRDPMNTVVFPVREQASLIDRSSQDQRLRSEVPRPSLPSRAAVMPHSFRYRLCLPRPYLVPSCRCSNYTYKPDNTTLEETLCPSYPYMVSTEYDTPVDQLPEGKKRQTEGHHPEQVTRLGQVGC